LISGLFLYTSIDPATHQRQCLTRRSRQSVPTVLDATRLKVSSDEMKAAIHLVLRSLDEQQPRLYAGLESMKLGHGGDGEHQIVEFSPAFPNQGAFFFVNVRWTPMNADEPDEPA
jgi:hypothetical protein